jgi:hypothetical protein
MLMAGIGADPVIGVDTGRCISRELDASDATSRMAFDDTGNFSLAVYEVM